MCLSSCYSPCGATLFYKIDKNEVEHNAPEMCKNHTNLTNRSGCFKHVSNQSGFLFGPTCIVTLQLFPDIFFSFFHVLRHTRSSRYGRCVVMHRCCIGLPARDASRGPSSSKTASAVRRNSANSFSWRPRTPPDCEDSARQQTST